MTDALAIYLNDHLAGATFGRELAYRMLGSNRGNEFEDFLGRLAGEIEEDREDLLRVIDRVGVRRNSLKVGIAWTGEKLGRLKLNGRLLGYSPLSRVLEFEALAGGVRAKLSLWQTLAALSDRLAPVGVPLQELIARAEAQLSGLEEAKTRAIGLAFRG